MNTRRAAVIVMLVTLAALAPTVRHEFTTWDDNYNITDNPHVNPPSIEGLQYVWTHEWMHLWVPVTYTAWIGIAAISNLNPHAFHAINLLVHLLGALAALCLLRRLKFSVPAATCGALVFAIHPVQVESVAWISGLKDVLSGTLCIASLVCWCRDGGRSYVASLVLFVLAMLAKPQAVALPLVAFAIDRWILHRSLKRSLTAIASMILLAIPIVVIGKLVQPASLVEHVPLWQRPFIAGEAIAFYLLKLVWPVKLGIDYGHTPQWVMQSRAGYFASMISLGLVMMPSPRVLRAATAVFVAALLPVLGFVTFDFQEKSTVADHYLYLAMLGVAIAVAFAFDRARPTIRPVFIAIIALLGVRSFLQSRVWADSRTLFAHAVEVNPSSAIAYNNLYVLAMDDRNGAEAERHARNMLRIKPNDMLSTTNLAGALAMQERFSEAEQLYRSATQRWPDQIDPYLGLGLTLLDQQRPREALEAFDAALHRSPNHPQIVQLRERARQASTTPP